MMTGTVPFMAFWAGLNAAMRARKQPEVRFGDARAAWETATSQAEIERVREIEKMAVRLRASLASHA